MFEFIETRDDRGHVGPFKPPPRAGPAAGWVYIKTESDGFPGVGRVGLGSRRVTVPAPTFTEASDKITYLAPMPRVTRGSAAFGTCHHNYGIFSVSSSILNEFSAPRSCTSRPSLLVTPRGTRIPTVASSRRRSASRRFRAPLLRLHRKMWKLLAINRTRLGRIQHGRVDHFQVFDLHRIGTSHCYRQVVDIFRPQLLDNS